MKAYYMLGINASKVIVKILQPRLQQYLNHELPDVQAHFRKGRGTRDQIDYAKAFNCVDQNKL